MKRFILFLVIVMVFSIMPFYAFAAEVETDIGGKEYAQNAEYGIMISGADQVLSGKSITLRASIKPYNKTNTSVVWSLKNSTDNAYVTLKKGKLTAKKVTEAHTVTVVASAKDGFALAAETSVTVLPKASSVAMFCNSEPVEGQVVCYDLNNPDLNSMIISASTLPLDAGDDIAWTISDKWSKYAEYTVADGTVTISEPTGKTGTVTMTAKASDGSGKKSVVKVKFARLAQEVNILNAPAEIKGGKYVKLKTDVATDKTLTDKGIVWKLGEGSSAFASVSKDGKLTAKNVSERVTVEVIAQVKANPTKQCIAEVDIYPAAKKAEIYQGDMLMAKGQTVYVDLDSPEIVLSGNILPRDAKQDGIWTSSDKRVATVANGIVTVHKAGKATITFKASDGTKKSTYIKIRAGEMVENICVKSEADTSKLTPGTKVQLNASVSPSKAMQKGVIWAVSDSSAASISSNGKLTVKNISEKKHITVTATAKDGSDVFGCIDMMVYPNVTGISIKDRDSDEVLNGSSIRVSLREMTDMQLDAVVLPFGENGTLQEVMWSSSNSEVADVGNDGKVTFLDVGTANIVAKDVLRGTEESYFEVVVVREALEYTIVYEVDGGLMPDAYSVAYTIENPACLPTPSKEGYTFEGWFENADFFGESVTEIVGQTGDKTYYAKWEPVVYGITYNLNGGALASGKTNPTSYTVETATFTLNNPTKTGYTFSGWTGSNGTTAQTSVSVTKGSTGNKTFTAKWKYDAPDYVIEEAERVADSIESKNSSNNMNIILASDFHNMGDGENSPAVVNQIRESNKHAGQAMALIADQVSMDFLAVLGDIAWGSDITTQEQAEQGIELAKEYLAKAMNKIEHSVLLGGNHDYQYGYSALSDYHYKDFEDKKIRAIFLNTADGKSENVSAEQLLWFADSLDMSEKEDAEEWGIIILSHHPLDWGSIAHAGNLLQAYLSGSSYTVVHNGTLVSCNFVGKNAATVIAQFHGNSHCFKVDYIHYTTNGVTRPTTVQRIAIPNACFYRTNEYGQNGRTEYYGIEFGESTTYGKTAGTAQDTSFCVVSINLDLKAIYVDCYGAGYDRVIHYGKETTETAVVMEASAEESSFVDYIETSEDAEETVEPTNETEAVTEATEPSEEAAESAETTEAAEPAGDAEEAVEEAAEYTIAYELNGGMMPENGVATSYTAESTVTLPTPSKEGYTFEGWFENADFSGEPVTEIVGQTGDKTYYAKWEVIEEPADDSSNNPVPAENAESSDAAVAFNEETEPTEEVTEPTDETEAATEPSEEATEPAETAEATETV